MKSSKFNDIWQKMVSKLEMGKKMIMDLIEQSAAAYEQREELCNKLQNLEGKSHNEQTIHLQVYCKWSTQRLIPQKKFFILIE